MSFAQPIPRAMSNKDTNTSWLTSGLNSRTSTYGGTRPPSGGTENVFPIFSGHPTSTNGSGGSTDNRRHEQNLINAYEAEEERIINVLSRKLEQLREDKIDLENALEAESESHVNKLAREISALRQTTRDLEAKLAEANAKLELNAQAQSAPGSSKQKDVESSMVPALVPNLSNLTLSATRGRSPQEPSATLMLDAMQRENETLRNRLVDTERDYVRVSRLNEIYREELIEHRTRLGLSVDNLIGLTSSDRDPFAHPTHHRSRSSSTSSSPSVSLGNGYHSSLYGFIGGLAPTSAHSRSIYQNANSNSNANSVISASTSTHVHQPPSYPNGVPIPRPPSQLHRPIHTHSSTSAANRASLSASPSSPAGSSYPLSPIYSLSGASSSSDSYLNSGSGRRRYSGSGASAATPASFVSVSTNITSPPSSVSMGMAVNGAFAVPQRGLSYPSVPPPSLSSSFGSPTVSFNMPHRSERDPSLSPVEPLSRRGSNAGIGTGAGITQGVSSRRGSHGGGGERRVVETGSLRRPSFDRSAGVPIGGRVAETGSLVNRSRAGSVNVGLGGHGTLPETVVEGDGDDMEGMELDIYSEAGVDEAAGPPPPPPLMDTTSGIFRPTIMARTLVSGNAVDSEGTPSAKSR